MLINKIGYDHIEYGINCQDYGYEKDKIKVVCDGCSEGKHSEVGAKSFCHLFQNNETKYSAFNKLYNMFGQSSSSIRDFLCFTILIVDENEENFEVSYCGDGYIIKETLDGNIEFEELNDGEYPKYFVYNYCDKKILSHYKDGVEFQTKEFNKSIYKRIGVASDGLRYILRDTVDSDLKEEFVELLKQNKEIKIKRFINRNCKIFKDDITIVF